MTRLHAAAAISLAMLCVAAAVGCRAPVADQGTAVESAPSPVLAVSAARVDVGPMRQETELLGITAALRHLTLRAPASGRVTGLALQSGDQVRRGEVVAHIINREEEAAQAGVAAAEKIDPKEAAALARSVKRYASGPGIPVVAPENAVVAQRLVSPGQLVNNLDPLLDLVDPNSVYVEAQVPIDQLRAIKPGMDATVTSSLSAGVGYPARVAALSPSFSAGGTTAAARLMFTGKERITEVGAAVEVHVTIRYAPAAIEIPAAALFQDAARGDYYVFTAGRDGRAHRTVVVPGIRNPAAVQITQGLQLGELVITSGGYALSDGLAIKVETLAGYQQ